MAKAQGGPEDGCASRRYEYRTWWPLQSPWEWLWWWWWYVPGGVEVWWHQPYNTGP